MNITFLIDIKIRMLPKRTKGKSLFLAKKFEGSYNPQIIEKNREEVHLSP